MEFDLVFPRNETYAPTLYFPLVLAARNTSAAWPLGMLLTVTIWPHDEEVPPWNSTFNFPDRGNSSRWGSTGVPPSSPHFFGIAGTNVTNGTVGGFTVLWSVSLDHTCVNPLLGLVDPLEQGYFSGSRSLRFSTAVGAPLPDVEAAVNACLPSTSTLGLTYTPYQMARGEDCPILDANSSTPIADTTNGADLCGLRPLAKDLAANVSTAMLGLMGCSEGTWQTIMQPCPLKPKSNGALQWRESPGMGWTWIWIPALVSTASVLAL
ncbi:hypothetical protein GE09DRAFT_981461 [Coniochaeta sp. 2T2.1]|nr:hypothetical protein GE09DRAFT_981461 [Coniochaeta sp. 2T2.1]